jgi:(4-O-methyl)-D-glucuronate---lignin esterase
MFSRLPIAAVAAVTLGMVVTAQQPAPQGTPPPPAGQAPPATSGQAPAAGAGRSTNLGSDPNGNPLRLALKTGHVSNYDEAKTGTYTLPDPLVASGGRPVRDAKAWRSRRAEILAQYEANIYGRIPPTAPKVTWQVAETDPKARDGAAVRKKIVGAVGSNADGPRITVTLTAPANSSKAVPVILLVNFGGGPPPPPGTAARGPGFNAHADPALADDILARGWGYATVGYADIQPDRATTAGDAVMALAAAGRPAGTPAPPDEWGTIGVWSWGVSRIIDYFETDKTVDAKRIAIFGHSRLGKTVLWASAKDERIAAVFSSCSGEMGAALARRDWGETVDDMAQNFAWQFAGAFQQYSGRWNDMPVDAHMLIALSAPRPVFITGGTADQWADPVGMFKAAVAAGPVYKLLGKKDVGATTVPPLDTPLITGDLGYHYHSGGHTATPADWKAFLTFLGKYFS